MYKRQHTHTHTVVIVMNCMLEYFIPVDDGIMDNEYHRHIRNQIKDPISVQDDREFSQEDVL